MHFTGKIEEVEIELKSGEGHEPVRSGHDNDRVAAQPLDLCGHPSATGSGVEDC
jgi:hypothetical protein